MVRNYEVPTVARYRPLINKATIGSLLNYIIYVNKEMNYCVGFLLVSSTLSLEEAIVIAH